MQTILLREIDEQQRCRLLLDMVRESRIAERFDEAKIKLEKLSFGFTEALRTEET